MAEQTKLTLRTSDIQPNGSGGVMARGQYTKPWKCPRGHVLGFVERRQLDGHKLTVLLVLRRAVDLQAEQPGGVEVMGVLEGGMTIICTVCQERRYFSPDVEALARLLERLRVAV